MGADAILWIAVGPLLFLGCAFVCAFALAQKVLRGGGEVEVEVKAPSLSFHVRAAGESLPRNTTNGAGTSATQEPFATEVPVVTLGRRDDEDSVNQGFKRMK